MTPIYWGLTDMHVEGFRRTGVSSFDRIAAPTQAQGLTLVI